MPDRRYDEDEVRTILARATEPRDEAGRPGQAGSMEGGGHSLTLAELQEVAVEAGISPLRVAEAAAALDSGSPSLARPTYFGVPISAEHVVHLPRMLEPEEWDRFVVKLRATFDAAGTVRSEGSLQTWSNGNLSVLLEPLEEGARLRFESVHGMSKSYLEGSVATGVSGAMLAVAVGALALFGGEAVPGAMIGLVMGVPVLGAAMWAIGRSRAGRWVPMREASFHVLGEEALRVVGAVDGGGGDTARLPRGSDDG